MSKITVTDVRWKRAVLELSFQVDEDCTEGADEPSSTPGFANQLYLYRVTEQRFIPFEIEDVGTYKIARLNVVMAYGREMLPKGQWLIVRKLDTELLRDVDTLLAARPDLYARMYRDACRFCDKEADEVELDEVARTQGFEQILLHPYDTYNLEYASHILEDLDACSRFFPYAKHTYVYTVLLRARETSAKSIALFLDVEFYVRNKKPRARQKSKRYRQKQILNAVFCCMKAVAHRSGNRVLFFKENGDGPTGNMAAFQQRFYERGLDQQFEVVERYRNTYTKRQNPFEWLADMWTIARADYIFVDDYTPIFNFLTLDTDVVLTQLWHAGVGFKSVGYARFGQVGSPDPFASGHRRYTYALVGNEHLRDIYSEVFGIEPQALLATGMPRLEHFLDEGTAKVARANLYERYPRLKDGRVILFAPTFRGTGQRGAYYPYQLLNMDALHRLCEETNSYFIYEMHHFITKRPEIPEEYAERILDLSDESLNELFFISDVLITDYSSCFYDYLLLNKPVVLYIPDKLTYVAIRGVQRPIDDMAPGEVCETFDSLLDTLYTKHYEEVLPKALTIDRAAERSGLASDRAIDVILFGRDVPGVQMGKE